MVDYTAPEGGMWSGFSGGYRGQPVDVMVHPGYDTPQGSWQWGVDLLSVPFKPWVIPGVVTEAGKTTIETVGETTGIPGVDDLKVVGSMALVGLALVAAIMFLRK